MATSSTATTGSAGHCAEPKVPQGAKRPGGSSLATFDLTIWKDQNPERDPIVKTLKEYAKKWVFQLEKNGEGKEHWQARISLFKKKRIAEFRKMWPLAGTFITPTCKTVHEAKNFNYMMKADTRVDGPWKDEDEEDVPVLTRQLRYFMAQEKRPWQEKLQVMLAEEDDRRIICIVDKTGNAGKSIFAEYLEYYKLAYEMPPFNDMQDIMACVMAIKTQKAYLVDMPKGVKKEKLVGMYAGLEMLKNGVAFDKRYAFKKRRFDRPQVCVFTNEEPQRKLLSQDRWCILYMYNHDLYTAETLPREGRHD